MNLTPEQIKAAEDAMRLVFDEAINTVTTDSQKCIEFRVWHKDGVTTRPEWAILSHNQWVWGPDLLKLISNLPDQKAAKRKQVESLRSQLATAEQELAKL